MGERYSFCCEQEECLFCGGTGFSGDAYPFSNSNIRPRPKTYTGDGFSMDRAVLAMNTYINKQREKSMSELVVQKNVSLEVQFGYNEKQMEYIRNKVCKNATEEELEQFFYRCSVLKLDPLMPGQIYFLKFKKRNPKPNEDPFNPGSIVIGIDGFRLQASRTGKLSGIKRGVMRDAKGNCIGGWADVYRKDWDHPAHLEVSLKEYADPWKDTWKDMPESMIQKVAEVGALRMAFPEVFGGVYSHEEMDQAGRKEREVESEVSPNSQKKMTPPALPVKKPSDAQLKRLFTIKKTHEYSDDELRLYMQTEFSKNSTRDLTLIEYDKLCSAMESGELRMGKEKEKKPEEPETEPSDSNEDLEEVGVSSDVPWAKYRDVK